MRGGEKEKSGKGVVWVEGGTTERVRVFVRWVKHIRDSIGAEREEGGDRDARFGDYVPHRTASDCFLSGLCNSRPKRE